MKRQSQNLLRNSKMQMLSPQGDNQQLHKSLNNLPQTTANIKSHSSRNVSRGFTKNLFTNNNGPGNSNSFQKSQNNNFNSMKIMNAKREAASQQQPKNLVQTDNPNQSSNRNNYSANASLGVQGNHNKGKNQNPFQPRVQGDQKGSKQFNKVGAVTNNFLHSHQQQMHDNSNNNQNNMHQKPNTVSNMFRTPYQHTIQFMDLINNVNGSRQQQQQQLQQSQVLQQQKSKTKKSNTQQPLQQQQKNNKMSNDDIRMLQQNSDSRLPKLRYEQQLQMQKEQQIKQQQQQNIQTQQLKKTAQNREQRAKLRQSTPTQQNQSNPNIKNHSFTIKTNSKTHLKGGSNNNFDNSQNDQFNQEYLPQQNDQKESNFNGNSQRMGNQQKQRTNSNVQQQSSKNSLNNTNNFSQIKSNVQKQDQNDQQVTFNGIQQSNSHLQNTNIFKKIQQQQQTNGQQQIQNNNNLKKYNNNQDQNQQTKEQLSEKKKKTVILNSSINNFVNSNRKNQQPLSKKNSQQQQQQQEQQNSPLKQQQQENLKDQNLITNSSEINIDDFHGLKNHLLSFGSKTQAGVNAKGPKTNQDAMIIQTNFLDSQCIHLFVALDGHGLYGHLVSNFVKKILPQKLQFALKREIHQLGEEKYVRNSLRVAFFQTSKTLLESNIDCTFSGTTCVLTLVIGSTIYCANIGDSRAVVGQIPKLSQNKNTIPKPLSRDHKPDDPTESQRIYNSGGRVDTYHDYDGAPIGPARVWLSDKDLPGLAMARSFGDLVAVQAGVICDPEIMVHKITEIDKMLVLGSDGIWEFVENQQALNIVTPYYHKLKPDIASIKLLNQSLNLWKQNDEVIDDITVIVVFFKDMVKN